MKKAFLSLTILFLFTRLSAQNLLLGTTNNGGTNSIGTIFKTDGNGNNHQPAFSFISVSGNNPSSTFLEAPNGKLYGMTNSGGAFNLGQLFEYDRATNISVSKYEFNDVSGT